MNKAMEAIFIAIGQIVVGFIVGVLLSALVDGITVVCKMIVSKIKKSILNFKARRKYKKSRKEKRFVRARA